MTLIEIAALSLEDEFRSFEIILNRLVDFTSIPQEEESYYYSEGVSSYEKLELHSSLSKPSLDAFSAELEIYREELRVVEQARLDEVARQESLVSRWDAVRSRDMGNPAFYTVVNDQPNARKYMHDLIIDKAREVEADDIMTQIEAKDIELVVAIEANQYAEDRQQAYPVTGDQLDNIFKALKYIQDNGGDIGVDGEAYVASIQAIKDAYPKPE